MHCNTASSAIRRVAARCSWSRWPSTREPSGLGTVVFITGTGLEHQTASPRHVARSCECIRSPLPPAAVRYRLLRLLLPRLPRAISRQRLRIRRSAKCSPASSRSAPAISDWARRPTPPPTAVAVASVHLWDRRSLVQTKERRLGVKVLNRRIRYRDDHSPTPTECMVVSRLMVPLLYQPSY